MSKIGSILAGLVATISAASVIHLTSADCFAEYENNHAAWTAFLAQHLEVRGSESSVDYAAIKANPAALDGYLAGLSAVPREQFDRFSKEERLAFLINAYNAFTIKLIVLNYPVDSIKQIGSFWQSAWKKRFFNLFGSPTSLDDIEHGIIRKEFKEPRVHFALVCASKGCPALQREAFVGSHLTTQLESAAQAFLNDSKRNHYDPEHNTLELSKIFDWYSEDFIESSGSIHGFVKPRITGNAAERLSFETVAPNIRFLDYDWRLNDKNSR